VNNRQVSYKNRLVLFCLIGLIIIGYVLRDLININFEPVLLVVFIYSVWIMSTNKDNNKRLLNTYLLIWSILLLCYWLIGIVLLSYHDNLTGRAYNQMNIIHATLIFILIAWSVYKTKPPIDYLWIMVGIGSFCIVILSFSELSAVNFHVVKRLGDFYGNPIGFGVLANTFLIVLIGAFPWAYRKNKFLFAGYLIMSLILLLSVILSQARSAWLGLPEAIVAWSVYYYFLYKSNHPNFNYRAFIKGLVLILVLMVFFFSSANLVSKRIGEIFSGADMYLSGQSFESSSGQRLLMYEAGITGIVPNIWLGIGENEFKPFMREQTRNIAELRFHQQFDGFDYSHVHNQFLMSLITKGILGFLSVVFLFIFLFVYFVKGMKQADMNDKPIWIAGFVFSLAEFMSFLPESPLQKSVYSTHFFLMTTLFIVFTQLIPSNKDRNKLTIKNNTAI